MRIGLLGLGIHNKSLAGYKTSYVNNLVSHAAIQGDTKASASTLTSLDAMMQSLINSSIDTKLDALWVFATDGDRNFSKYNVLNPGTFDCAENGTLTFTSLQGFTGDGTTGYLNTNFAPLINGANYQLNSASFGFFAPVFNTSSTIVNMGCRTSGSPLTALTYPSQTGDNALLINTNNTSNITIGPNTTSGLRHYNRSGASAIQRYVNGVLAGSNTNTSGALSNQPFYIFAMNNAGSPLAGSYSNSRIAIAFAGASLVAEAPDLYTAFNTYLSSL